MKINRRHFNQAAFGCAALAVTGFAAQDSLPTENKNVKIPLGFDNFSIRALNWKAPQLLAFAEQQNLDYVLWSDLGVFENSTKSYLNQLRSIAADKGIKIQIGTGSICPTSNTFKKENGDAVEHLKLCINIASNIGSNVVRCYLGNQADRFSKGGIQTHIAKTVDVLKTVRELAIDNGVVIAVENHAGDMQAHELVGLVKEAGEDFVGVTVDSGNATWTLEDPHTSLETLAPHVVCSGMRDSVVWSTKDGIRVAWTAIGEGQIDWITYIQTFAKLCPGVPFQLETISGFNKQFKWFDEDFWRAYPKMKASEFAKYYRMSFGNEPVPTAKSGDPEYQMNDLKKSIEFCKNELRLGLK